MKIVSLEKIKENYYEIIKKAKGRKVYFVLKADAYGLGMVGIARYLISLGAFNFCVVKINEALILRKLNSEIKILLLSDFNINEIDVLRSNNITVSISDVLKAKQISDMNVEIKVNTGMNRYGIGLDSIEECLDILEKNNLSLMGIYTHIGNYKSQEFFKQYFKFSSIVKKFENINIHFASSKGLDLQMDLYNSVRIGMALYSDNVVKIVEKIKRKTFCLKDSVIGYNDYVMTTDGYIGIIDVGYSDGILRANRGRYVYIKNKFYKIISVCMNHTIILIDEKVMENDEVELLGENVKIEYLCNYLQTIDYEILTSFKNQDILYL